MNDNAKLTYSLLGFYLAGALSMLIPTPLNFVAGGVAGLVAYALSARLAA